MAQSEWDVSRRCQCDVQNAEYCVAAPMSRDEKDARTCSVNFPYGPGILSASHQQAGKQSDEPCLLEISVC